MPTGAGFEAARPGGEGGGDLQVRTPAPGASASSKDKAATLNGADAASVPTAAPRRGRLIAAAPLTAAPD